MTDRNDWQLGIDYGTTYTVAAVAQGQTVTVIDVESNGRSRMPSSVFLNQDGRILVGTAAQHQASFAPERFEATPKRLFGEGEIFLGDRLVEVTELAAAAIRRVYSEASRQQGETAPAVVRVTHPAMWANTRLAVLREAVEKAGISKYELIAEPVAAAARIGLLATKPGDLVAVYDFGGGTFDAAVLRRTQEGFEVAGRPVGRDPLGGEEIDQQLVEHLASVLAAGHEEQWASLTTPPDSGWRRRAMELRAEVQRAKETLSEATVCQLWIPGLERDAQITRDELNDLIRADVNTTVDTLEAALAEANVKVADLAGIYLVGGSSRIPLVADMILGRTGVMPSVQENPKSIVAMGAAGWDLLNSASRAGPVEEARITVQVPEIEATVQTAPAPAPPATTPAPAAVPGLNADGLYLSRLAMAIGMDAWPDGCTCVSEMEIDRLAPPPLTVRVRDEPARARTTAEQADVFGRFRAQRTPGYAEHGVGPAATFGRSDGVERRFAMLSGGAMVEMMERYLTVDGRALTAAIPADARIVGDRMGVAEETRTASSFFESRLAVTVPLGWTVTERVTLRRNQTGHTVAAACSTLPGHIGFQAWRERVLREAAANRDRAEFAASVAAPVLNRFDGELASLLWTRDGVPMMTKVGLAGSGGFGFLVTITLPRDHRSQFASLARQARVRRFGE